MERVPYVEGLLPETSEIAENRQSAWKRFCSNPLAVVGMVILILSVLTAVFASFIAPYGYEEQNLSAMLMPPDARHIFGTDNFGRDIFSRVVYGSRISITIGLISVGIGCSVGMIAGIVAAWFGGIVDHVVMCIIDIMLSLPGLMLAISLSAALGPGLRNAMIAVGISSIPVYARIVRGSVMDVRGQEYIEAAIIGGADFGKVIIRHIIPNILAPVLVQAFAGMAGAILTAASLSFIGLGIQPPTPE